MSNTRYFQPEIETMPLEEMRALQTEKLKKQVRHIYDNVPYYRAKMERKGVTPEDIQSIDDLHKLPFISKDDLRDQYPTGFLAVPQSECVRIHSTSGTTGRRVVAFYTQHDVDLWEDCCAHCGCRRHQGRRGSRGLRLRSLYGRYGTPRRLPQGGLPDSPHVLG